LRKAVTPYSDCLSIDQHICQKISSRYLQYADNIFDKMGAYGSIYTAFVVFI